MRRLTSEAAAYELLEQLRRNGEPVCPHCGTIGQATFLQPVNGVSRATRTGKPSQRRVWKCNACRKQFTVLVGTIFHDTKIPVRTWVLVILEMVASKNGVAARDIERKYDLTNKTAWFMLQRIREAIKCDPLPGLLSGTVAADESSYGGKPHNQFKAKPAPRRGWMGSRVRMDKPIVLALADTRMGEVRSRVIADVKGPTLREAIAEQVEMGATTLVTDEAPGYQQFSGEMKGHARVNQACDEYVNPRGYTTNQAEAYFGQLKRSIDDTHHHVSREHLARYLAQHDFLRSTYTLGDSTRLCLLVAQTGGRRLTYKPLTGAACTCTITRSGSGPGR